MAIAKKFIACYQVDYLKEYYIREIENDANTGVDRINTNNFNKNLDAYCNLVSRKVLDGSYNFVPYKEILLLKGKGKYPRSISIPAIRDKLVLSILKDILHNQFTGCLRNEYVKKMISRVYNTYVDKKYTTFIKIDMKDFYGSLNHDYLLKRVWRKGRKTEFLHILKGAITTPTIAQSASRHSVKKPEKGVPQGLPISNVLADIYMIDFDNRHLERENYEYFRYVDDILIICHNEDVDKIYKEVICELKNKLMLEPHPIDETKNKTYVGELDEGFSYLGYVFTPKSITVRKKSKQNIERMIERLFNEYHNSEKAPFDAFLWKLNLKITGMIFDNNSYGWLMYYSQINNEVLMYELDNFVQKLFKRYLLSNKLGKSKLKLKRFVRSYHEIKKNKRLSKYIPNFDNIVLEEKLKILDICSISIRNRKDEEQVNIVFKSFMKKNIRELEKDRGRIS